MTTLLAQLEAKWRGVIAPLSSNADHERGVKIGREFQADRCADDLHATVAQMTCENCRHWVPFDSFTSSPVCSELEVRMNRNEYCSRFQPIVAHTPRPTDTETK